MDQTLLAQFTSADDTACEAAAIALGQQGSMGLPLLGELLTVSKAEARFWAVRGLWANGSPEAVALLISVLADEEDMVRSGAALALGELRAETAIEALAGLFTLQISASGDHAAIALAKIGQPAAPSLVIAMQDARFWVRVRAIRALAAIPNDETIQVLFTALKDDSYLVRHYAEEALARLGQGQMVYFSRIGS